MVGGGGLWVYIGLGKIRSLKTNVWVCDWAEAGSEQGEEGVGKKVESKF